MEIGGRTFDVVTNPIFDAAGQRLGTVGEWVDRTDQLRIEGELGEVVTAAVNGDFTCRIDPEGKEGFYRQLAVDLNRLLDVSARGLNDVARVLNAIARGVLTERIEAEYAGTFGQLKDDANTTVDRLKEVVGRIQEATQAIDTAAHEIATGNGDLSSRTEEQASSLEETASSME